MTKKEYILKHNDDPVLEFTIDTISKFVDYIHLFDDKFSPINSKSSEGGKIVSFNNWLNNRCISDTRDGTEYLKKYNINNLKELMILQYGLSLSDHYWIDRKPFNHQWKDINLFENRYNDVIGNILFDKNFKLVENIEHIKGTSPDITTGGNLKKRWIYNEDDSKSYLIKGSSKIYKQEPFNEYFAHLLLDEIKFDHTYYNIKKYGDEYASICPCISDINTEMVSADDLRRKYGFEKSYEALISFGQEQGCTGFVDSVNKMIIADFMIDNTDRHWNNFGILRDAVSGAWLGMIPLFDNGYSLWNNDFINNDIYSESQSFKDYNIDNMNYVNMSNYVETIPNMTDLFDKAFEKYDNEERKNQLRNGISIKQDELKKYLERQR